MKLLRKLVISTIVTIVVAVVGSILRVLLYPRGKHHRR